MMGIEGTHRAPLPNVSLIEPLWPLIVGIAGIIEGSWGVKACDLNDVSHAF